MALTGNQDKQYCSAAQSQFYSESTVRAVVLTYMQLSRTSLASLIGSSGYESSVTGCQDLQRYNSIMSDLLNETFPISLDGQFISITVEFNIVPYLSFDGECAK